MASLEQLIHELPSSSFKKTFWIKQKEKHKDMVRHAELLFGQLKESYEQVQNHRTHVLEQRKKTTHAIRSLKQKSRTSIRAYQELQQVLEHAEHEMQILDEGEQRDTLEQERDTTLDRREDLALCIVDATTELKYLKERLRHIIPLLESVKQTSYAINQDYKHAENCFAEMVEETRRYADGILSRTSIKEKEKTLEKITKRYTLIMLKEVDRTEFKQEEFPAEGTKAQLINDEYVEKCIEYIETINNEYAV
jgi:chromosome segregation ATPase